MPELVGLDGRRPGAAEPAVVVPKGFVAFQTPGSLPHEAPQIFIVAKTIAMWAKDDRGRNIIITTVGAQAIVNEDPLAIAQVVAAALAAE